MRIIDIIASILLIIGGLILGLGLFGISPLSLIFGENVDLIRLTNGLIGLSALWKIFSWRNCGHCETK